MLRKIYLSLFLCTLMSAAFCQNKHRDSLTKAAQEDAKTFRLDHAIWKKYKRKLLSTSDYFKPDDANKIKPGLTTDSIYVEAYRKAAFKKTEHRRTPWHYVLVGGGILAIGYVALVTYIVSAY
jgi:hypothetical protein